MHDSLTDIAIIILVALAAGLVSERLRQPPVLGFILAGVLLGPSAFALVQDREQIEILAEMGVLMLLFLVGIEMPTTSFRRVWKTALSAAIGQVAISLTLTTIIAFLFSIPLATAIVFGFIVTLSSTAVVIKLLNGMNITASPPGQLIVGILVAQDLIFIPMILVVGILAEHGSGDGISMLDIARVILSIILMVMLLYLLNRKGSIHLPLQKVAARQQELKIIRAVAMCFGSAALSGLAGFSAAYGAFLIGIVVAHSDERQSMLNTVRPIEILLMMMFFLSIGLLIDLGYIIENWLTVLVALSIVMIVKTILNIFLLRIIGEPWHHALMAGFLLAQIGEFSFLINKAAENGGLISSQQSILIITTTALSLTMTPIWLACARYGVRWSLSVAYGRDFIFKALGTYRNKKP